MTHTPTPWKAIPIGEKSDEPTVCYVGDCRIVVEGARRYDDHAEDQQDAEFIVRAVNSLPALVKALERISRDARDRSERAAFRLAMIADEADAALAAFASHKTGG
jgi:hypothetical protein